MAEQDERREEKKEPTERQLEALEQGRKRANERRKEKRAERKLVLDRKVEELPAPAVPAGMVSVEEYRRLERELIATRAEAHRNVPMSSPRWSGWGTDLPQAELDRIQREAGTAPPTNEAFDGIRAISADAPLAEVHATTPVPSQPVASSAEAHQAMVAELDRLRRKVAELEEPSRQGPTRSDRWLLLGGGNASILLPGSRERGRDAWIEFRTGRFDLRSLPNEDDREEAHRLLREYPLAYPDDGLLFCPLPGCDFRGTADQLRHHTALKHPEIAAARATRLVSLNPRDTESEPAVPGLFYSGG